MNCRPFQVVLACGLAMAAAPCLADVVDLLNGSRLEGTVTKIDKEQQQVTFRRVVGGRNYERTYPYSGIHAVTIGDKQYVLNERSGDAVEKDPAKAGRGEATREEIERRIEQQGSTPPDWYETIPLNYPKTLDLSWPEPAPPPWNNQRNVAQYLWDVVNPNPGRWKEGVRLLHHLLEINQDRPAVRLRAMHALGRAYHVLLEDHARAAFWWQKAGVGDADSSYPESAISLAECYHRLGSKPMAEELLRQIERSWPSLGLIKAWGDLGEPAHALQLAENYARGNPPLRTLIYLQAGDVCRTDQKFEQAMAYYAKALASPSEGRFQKRIAREKERARANLEAVKLFELCDPTRVPDGRYAASSLGYAGPLAVDVTVRSGRITAVEVTQHEEKQFYAALTETPAKIVQVQGVRGVDATSGATITSEAIINATAKALAAARK